MRTIQVFTAPRRQPRGPFLFVQDRTQERSQFPIPPAMGLRAAL